jgi:predicted  nucleic acid-binding Zn-ribbon protein
MAVISEVKCGRCDRRYSGFRSRCPYCGARRNKRGKHADETENATAKLVIGILLLVVLIAATMVLIFSTIRNNPDPEAGASPSMPENTLPAETDNEDDVISVSGTSPSEEPTESPSESPTSPSIDPNAKVASVIITHNGIEKDDITMYVGDELKFDFETSPETDDKVPIWSSSDNAVFGVTDGKVLAISKGTANLTVTVDDITAKCIIRVRSR